MLASSVYLIVFRIVHIVSGVTWGGSVFLFVVFIQPSSAAIGPAAAPFMAELLGKRKLVNVILWIATFTIVGGLFLYWHDWHLYGGLGRFLDTGFGIGLTVGAVAAILAYLIGLFGTKPGVDRLLALGRQVAEAGGPPTPEIAAELPALQARLKVLARTSLALIAIAVLAMATARVW
ncbi:MAG TPA: hypothetical protein VF984_12555 [Actinomycetota bacterium]